MHAISAAIDSQQSVHPIRTFTGGLSRRFRLRSISHADRMQKSHAARSRSRHRTFVTEVNMCAQLVILTVYFASFSSQRHSNCFTGSKGSVCAPQHTRWSQFPLCIDQNLTASTTKPVTTIAFDYLLQRQPCFSSPFSSAWTAPPDPRFYVRPR